MSTAVIEKKMDELAAMLRGKSYTPVQLGQLCRSVAKETGFPTATVRGVLRAAMIRAGLAVLP